ncbi:class I SAM-dependent methyltransferase [Nocardioides mangrovi]|uniref:Class I SAM-dependent methyltransferase n=1 Tax=Nocardioides mangrovi TaxID=2874580 RepID=A0ABS7UIW2_9ACTN|nr:class I SAM-dependent methyltransferase [Nocardioides mangrovi]MBZ5740964.1 class I SAM-dependent methyltransferase [Nocardioides mangrovi]
MTTRWQRIAVAGAGEDYATRYYEGFRARAERGEDIHGEAAFVADLVPAPARVLDAGCGTGRITVRLAELGYDVVGVDVDTTMLAVARREHPGLDWRDGDLASFELGETFDLVLLAGNIIPLLEPGTLLDVAQRLAEHVASGGVVVCGFGLDAEHLPGDCPVTDLADVDAAFGVHGLDAVARYASWDGDAFEPGGGYAVTLYAEPRR